MAEYRLVVTGANAPLAQSLLKALLSSDDAGPVLGLVSPWCDQSALLTDTGRLSYLAADLSAPLPVEAAEALRAAKAVLHLAWIRSGDAETAINRNLAMLDNLTTAMDAADRLYFMSSVAAGADAPSAYGRSKFLAEERVRALGGNVLVCGLVMSEPPQTAFKMLVGLVTKLPLAVRFVLGAPRVYPVALADLEHGVRDTLRAAAPVGTVALYRAGGVALNAFLRRLETRRGGFRLPLPLPAGPILAAGRLARHTPLKGPGEKIATFLYKDDRRLAALPPPPGLDFSETDAFLGSER